MKILSMDEFHCGIVDVNLPDGPFICTLDPKGKAKIVTPTQDWIDDDQGHALVGNAIGEWRPVNYPEKGMTFCKPPGGTVFLTVDGLDLVELPDLQYWIQVTGAFRTEVEAERVADTDWRIGIPVSIEKRSRYVKYKGLVYMLVLDRTGNIPREKRP